MERSYTFHDHTADVLFTARAPTVEQLFEQCALAVEDTQVDISCVKQKKEVTIIAKSNKIDRLLYDFLDDLLYYKDAESLIFSKFKVVITEENGEYHLHCTASGDTLDPLHHKPKVDVKAITMHMFEVKQGEKGWKAKVLLDI
ncbi:archease [Candidatus Woesearchaeota archaeon]|nr:archease [Candidatus Woesearchaeota archaeon]